MATGTGAGLFEEKRAQSVYKHAILKQYLPRLIAKVGSVTQRVVLVDGYAGTGSSGSGPGSAALMLAAAQNTHSSATVEIHLVESDPKNYAKLREVAEMFRRGGIKVHDQQGKVEEHLPRIIDGASDDSLFLFLDPCGALLPFESIASILSDLRQKTYPPTEALLNFSDDLVRRAAGQFLRGSSDQGGAQRLDRVCGGGWWRKIASDLTPTGSSRRYEPIALAVADGYAKRLGATSNMSAVCVPVRKKLEHQPIYHLIFLTRHKEGLWSFVDSLGAARPDWLEAMPADPDQAELDLFTSAGIDFGTATLATQMKQQALKDQNESVERLKANIIELASTRQRFSVVDHIDEVFNGVLGVATAKQVGAALGGLVKDERLVLVTKDRQVQRRQYSMRS